MLTRRRVLLGLWALAVAVALAVVLGATGILGGSTSTRTAVSRYIVAVDTVQQQLRLPLTQLQTAYAGFSTQRTGHASAAKLARAEQTLQTVERRLAALPAPPAAATLRALLLRLVRGEASLARELDRLALFMPRFHSLVAQAARADAVLSRRLAAAAPPKPHVVRGTAKQIAQAKAAFAAATGKAAAAQADAVQAYDLALAGVLRRLRGVRPPAVMAPAYRTEVRMLDATRAAGAALARGLRETNRSRVPDLSRALTEAARLSGSLAAQRAEIAAVKAYDARVRTVGADLTRVQSEVTRLQGSLG